MINYQKAHQIKAALEDKKIVSIEFFHSGEMKITVEDGTWVNFYVTR
jgi:hypothetical protein